MASKQSVDLPPPQHRGDDRAGALEYPFSEVPGPGELLAIDQRISWLRMPLPFRRLDHINLYVLDDGETYTLVDSGLATDEARRIWRRLREMTQFWFPCGSSDRTWRAAAWRRTTKPSNALRRPPAAGS